MFEDKIITITGGAGFVGSHLADKLLQYVPKKIFLFDNLSQSTIKNIEHLLDNDRVEFIHGDIRDDTIKPYILESDYLFNLATVNMGFSELQPRLAMEVNVNGIFNIMQMCRKNPKIKVVHASSGSVIGNIEGKTDEDSKLDPGSFYAVSKMAGEKYVRYFAKEYGVKATVARYYHVFGPRQRIDGKAGVVCIFLDNVKKYIPPCIWGDGKQVKRFTFVKDTVAATIMLAENNNTIGGVYNIVSDNKISIKELAHKLVEETYLNKDIKLVLTYGPAKVGEIMLPRPSNKKIKELGWEPKYTFEEGLRITKEWIDRR